MIRPDYLIFGYATVTVPEEASSLVASRFFKKGISVKIKNGKMIIPRRKLKFVLSILDGIEYSVSNIKGVYGFLLSRHKRYGLIAAMLVSVFIAALSSNVVWDVRIEGCESGKEVEILESLSAEGLYVGAPWWRINRSEIELGVLKSSDDVSWININRRGSVAYVRVVDMDVHESAPRPVGYANIVAARDCIIEEITVSRGVAMVKPGESVKEGDVLISGVIPTELGGGYCYAEGNVIARYTERISVDISDKTAEKIYADENIGSLTFNFFSFPINIFKICRNSQESCDIIEKRRTFDIFGVTLPFSFDYTIVRPYVEQSRTLSTDELIFTASEEIREKTLDVTETSELLSVSTDGDFTATGYSMWAHLVLRADVGSVLEFDFDLE